MVILVQVNKQPALLAGKARFGKVPVLCEDEDLARFSAAQREALPPFCVECASLAQADNRYLDLGDAPEANFDTIRAALDREIEKAKAGAKARQDRLDAVVGRAADDFEPRVTLAQLVEITGVPEREIENLSSGYRERDHVAGALRILEAQGHLPADPRVIPWLKARAEAHERRLRAAAIAHVQANPESYIDKTGGLYDLRIKIEGWEVSLRHLRDDLAAWLAETAPRVVAERAARERERAAEQERQNALERAKRAAGLEILYTWANRLDPAVRAGLAAGYDQIALAKEIFRHQIIATLGIACSVAPLLHEGPSLHVRTSVLGKALAMAALAEKGAGALRVVLPGEVKVEVGKISTWRDYAQENPNQRTTVVPVTITGPNSELSIVALIPADSGDSPDC